MTPVEALLRDALRLLIAETVRATLAELDFITSAGPPATSAEISRNNGSTLKLPHDVVAPATLINGPAAKKELINTVDLAAMLGVSPRAVRRLRAHGKLPAPIRIGRRGGRIVWRTAEIHAWRAAGSPSLEVWTAIRERPRK